MRKKSRESKREIRQQQSYYTFKNNQEVVQSYLRGHRVRSMIDGRELLVLENDVSRCMTKYLRG